jgi:hypothetical protein
MRLFSIYIFFALTEYILRTFVNAYKYYEVGLFLEFLPLIIASLTSAFFYNKIIENRHLGWMYLKLTAVSIGGLLTAKTILFFQWYWVIAPENRGRPHDMFQGLCDDLLFFIIASIIISLSYIVAVFAIKLIYKKA